MSVYLPYSLSSFLVPSLRVTSPLPPLRCLAVSRFYAIAIYFSSFLSFFSFFSHRMHREVSRVRFSNSPRLSPAALSRSPWSVARSVLLRARFIRRYTTGDERVSTRREGHERARATWRLYRELATFFSLSLTLTLFFPLSRF